MSVVPMESYTLHLLPGDTLLLEELPARAIALDGCVQSPQQGSEDRWSLDHHDGCLRLVTQATCEQVRTALCLGGSAWAKDRDVFVNDLDGDTVLSLWLLSNPARANEPNVRALVRAVGAIDAHGPAGAFLLSDEENAMATLYFRGAISPVSDLRGKVREEFSRWEALIASCFEGIESLLERESFEVPPPPAVAVEVTDVAHFYGHKVGMATSEGWAFSTLYERGFDAAIVYTDAANGTRTFTIAKRSDLVNVNVKAALTRLSSEEEGWGGGSSIGGSPRKAEGESSSLSPARVWELFLEVC